MSSHYYSVYPRLLTHCPRLYISWSSTLTLWGSLARTEWHTGGAYDLCILHNSIPSNATSSSLKTGKLIFMWAPASPHHIPLWGAGSLLTSPIVMTPMGWSTLSSCHFQTHSVGMAMGVEVVGVLGLFYIYYGSGSLEAIEVIVCGLNWHLWKCPFRVNLPIGQI